MILKSPGGIENLVIENIPTPVIGDNEVLVKVAAISLNPVDATLRKNGEFLRLVLHLQKDEAPVILGWDISGVVEATGRGVTRLRKGDHWSRQGLCGICRRPRRSTGAKTVVGHSS